MQKRFLQGWLVAAGMVAGLAACSPLGVINALGVREDVRVDAGIAYGEGERRRLDVYAPAGAIEPAPVVVFFYGGSWNNGSRSDYAFVGHALASRGMVTVVADYRLYPEVRYPAFLEDSAHAVAWAAREIGRYGGNPQRLFVMGHSAGGYNAAMLALDARWLRGAGADPSMLDGWIGLAGPYDFIPIINPDVRPVFHHPDTPPESQPVNQVTGASPPALLIAASNDMLVNPERNTGGLAERLRQAGVWVAERYYDRVGHATLIASLSPPLRGFAPTLDEIERFVKSTGPSAGAIRASVAP